jgi:outer membrane protein insertion porin family
MPSVLAVALNEGDVLDTRLLELSLRRIAGLGFVELPAPVELKPSAEDEHRLDVTIHVRERPRPRFEVGGTLGGIEGGSLSAALSNGSVFGCGERVDLVVQGGSRVEQFGFAFEKPYVFGLPGAVGVRVDKGQLEFPGSEPKGVPGYRDARSTLRLDARLTSRRPVRLSSHYSYAFIDTEPRPADITPPVGRFGHRRESELGAEVVRDTVGQCWMPRRGYRLAAGVSAVGGPLGGDLSLVEPRLQGVGYLPLTPITSLGARIEMAAQLTYGASAEIPFDRRYALGGPTELRGYEPREVGPRDSAGRVVGGDKRLLLNLEYALDAGSRMRAVLFFDAGNAFREGDALDPTRLRTSVGAEVRLRLPLVGIPLRLIYAVRLPVDTLRRSSAFSVGLGSMFAP